METGLVPVVVVDMTEELFGLEMSIMDIVLSPEFVTYA